MWLSIFSLLSEVDTGMSKADGTPGLVELTLLWLCPAIAEQSKWSACLDTPDSQPISQASLHTLKSQTAVQDRMVSVGSDNKFYGCSKDGSLGVAKTVKTPQGQFRVVSWEYGRIQKIREKRKWMECQGGERRDKNNMTVINGPRMILVQPDSRSEKVKLSEKCQARWWRHQS